MGARKRAVASSEGCYPSVLLGVEAMGQLAVDGLCSLLLHPTMHAYKLINNLVDNGVDLIEFGIPFSDPTADGPTFQAACERALKKRMTPAKGIQGIKKLRESGLEVPLIVTTYYNIPMSLESEFS